MRTPRTRFTVTGHLLHVLACNSSSDFAKSVRSICSAETGGTWSSTRVLKARSVTFFPCVIYVAHSSSTLQTKLNCFGVQINNYANDALLRASSLNVFFCSSFDTEASGHHFSSPGDLAGASAVSLARVANQHLDVRMLDQTLALVDFGVRANAFPNRVIVLGYQQFVAVPIQHVTSRVMLSKRVRTFLRSKDFVFGKNIVYAARAVPFTARSMLVPACLLPSKRLSALTFSRRPCSLEFSLFLMKHKRVITVMHACSHLLPTTRSGTPNASNEERESLPLPTAPALPCALDEFFFKSDASDLESMILSCCSTLRQDEDILECELDGNINTCLSKGVRVQGVHRFELALGLNMDTFIARVQATAQ